VNALEPIENLQLPRLRDKWFPQTQVIIHQQSSGINGKRMNSDNIHCPELDIWLRRKSSTPAKDGSGQMVRNNVMSALVSYQESPGA